LVCGAGLSQGGAGLEVRLGIENATLKVRRRREFEGSRIIAGDTRPSERAAD